MPCKLTGRCGSVRVRLVPAPRGTGLVAAGVPKKLLTMAGVDDAYTSCGGKTRTVGNFVHVNNFCCLSEMPTRAIGLISLVLLGAW